MALASPLEKARVSCADSQTSGNSSFTSTRITKEAGSASCFQKVAPRVLGMISEKYRMARVSRKAIRVS